ncbi:RING finger domain protein [Penicillium brasilianum]|uniref:RING finger domain protein n=1 Tax=Penicillium brasilianum TaxID=104259 RepID=A0A1S9R9J4_PENBI|nr:RING finger domain protein [Penicillium brasilianum]
MAGGDGSETEASGLVNTLQGHVDDIRSRLQCGICIRPLYEPFSLACGHTFCYTCLAQWFSGGRSKRTCPDCRAPVKTQPAPAYLVREIVHMFTSRAELLDKGETTAEHLSNRQAESEKLDQDKANTHPHTGGLFGGLFKPKAPALKPLIDVDDGVMRCPNCQWELEEDACGGCGWIYRPDEDITDYSGSDEDDYDDETDDDSMLDGEDPEDDEFGDIDVDDSAWGPYGAYGRPFLFGEGGPSAAALFGPFAHALGDHVYPPHPWGPVPAPGDYDSHYEDDDFEEEEDEYDEMDSFIDDEERTNGVQYDSDHSTVVGANGPPNRASPTRRQGRPVVNLDSSDEDTSDPEDGDTTGVSFADGWTHHPSGVGASSSPPSQYHDTRSTPMGSSLVDDEASEDEDGDDDDDEDDIEVDDDDDDEDDEEPLVSRGRYRQRLEVPASSDGSEVTESPSPRLMRPARHTGSSTHNAITIADSDEEQPVGPVRRATQTRRARFSPY